MKKAKITVNEGSPGRVLPLFTDPETVYHWLTESQDDPTLIYDLPGVEHLTLSPGEFIEVEWMGCEYAFDSRTQLHTRIDLVRLGKAAIISSTGGTLASLHAGWTAPHVIPFKDYEDQHITVRELTPENTKLDLAALFEQLGAATEKK